MVISKIINFCYNKPKTLLILIAITVFVVVSSSLQLFTNAYSSEYIPGDSYSYIRASDLLYNNLRPHDWRPFGYSLFVGLPNVIFDKPKLNIMISWNFIFNFSLWIITILTLFKSLRLNLNLKSSLLLTMSFIFCIGNIVIASVILTETMAGCLLTLISYKLLYYNKIRNILSLAIAISLMNFLVLVKPGMIYIAVVFNIIFLGYFLKNKISPSIKIFFPIVFTLSMIFLQSLSMYKTHGNFIVSYVGSYAWYSYLGAESKADNKNISFKEEKKIRRSIMGPMPPNERYDLSRNDFKNQITNSPRLIFANFASNIIDNIAIGSNFIYDVDEYHKFKYFNYIKYYMYLISKAQNILFSILGLFLTLLFLIRYKSLSLPLFMTFTIICYIIITSGISFGQGDRFHLVIYPLVLIVLSYFLANYKWFKKEQIENNIKKSEWNILF